MKREVDFIAEISSIETTEDYIKIIGRNCEKDLRLGDKLNYMEIIKIEAYGKELDICVSGMTCGLTLKRNKSQMGYDMGHYHLEKCE